MVSVPTAAAVMEALQKKGVNLTRPCSECGKGEWNMESTFSILIELQFGTAGEHNIDLGAGVPLSTISCKNCGNTRFFHLRYAGVLPA